MPTWTTIASAMRENGVRVSLLRNAAEWGVRCAFPEGDSLTERFATELDARRLFKFYVPQDLCKST